MKAIDRELAEITMALAERDLDDEDDPRFVELAERREILVKRRERLVEAAPATVIWA